MPAHRWDARLAQSFTLTRMSRPHRCVAMHNRKRSPLASLSPLSWHLSCLRSYGALAPVTTRFLTREPCLVYVLPPGIQKITSGRLCTSSPLRTFAPSPCAQAVRILTHIPSAIRTPEPSRLRHALLPRRLEVICDDTVATRSAQVHSGPLSATALLRTLLFPILLFTNRTFMQESGRT